MIRFLSCSFLLLATSLSAEPLPLPVSKNASIELLTIEPGPLFFERFGHSAICVVDFAPRCYNFGVARFDEGLELTWGILQGHPTFWVSEHSYEHTVQFYRKRKRTIWQQTLPFSPDQVNQVVHTLDDIIARKKEKYAYHHFQANCSTKIRDLLDPALGGILSQSKTMPGTLREMGRSGYLDSLVVLLGTDLIMGRPIDAPLTFRGSQFTPVGLMNAVTKTTGAPPKLLNQGKQFPVRAGHNGRLFVALLGLAVFVTALVGLRLPPLLTFARWAGTFLVGILGLFPWFLFFASQLPEMRVNEVLLHLMPMDFLLLKLGHRWIRSYLAARSFIVLTYAVLLLAGIMIQPTWHWLILSAAVLASHWLAVTQMTLSPRKS